MQVSKPNLFARDDTFFGVCEGLGEDLGFHPNFLRVTLAVVLLWNPVLALGAYAGAGVVVAFSRLVVRKPRAAKEPVQVQAGEPATVQAAANLDAEMAEAA
jgi:phage shock protein C